MDTSFWQQLLNKPDTLYLILSLIAIIVGAALIVVISRFLIVHRERMAMIKQGIHPDFPPIDEVLDQNQIKGGTTKPA